MKWKEIVISILLLFVYSFSFAHSLMPHENGFYAEHQPEFHSDELSSHNHAHDHSHSENGIVHENHFDESVFDLILCLFSDIHHHHPDTNDSHLVISNSNDTKIKNSFPKADFNVLTDSKTDTQFVVNQKVNKLIVYNDYSIFLSTSTSRGPPILS